MMSTILDNIRSSNIHFFTFTSFANFCKSLYCKNTAEYNKDAFLRKGISLQDNDFNTLVEKYKGMIYHIMNKLRINDRDGEFFHIGMIALWKASVNFEVEKGEFSPFVYSYIQGELLTELKRRGKFSNRHALYEEVRTIESASEEQEIVDEIFVHSLAESLPTPQGEWLKKKVFEGKTTTMIAEELGATVPQVKGWRRRAITKLKRLLQQEKGRVTTHD